MWTTYGLPAQEFLLGIDFDNTAYVEGGVNVSQHLSMSKRVASLRLGLVNLDGAWVTHFGGVVTKGSHATSQF